VTPGDDIRARIDELFDAALDLAPAERQALLEDIAEPEVRREVEELLELAAEDDPRLDASALLSGSLFRGLADAITVQPAVLSAGDRVGPWRVLREIGRGGMGTVFLVERAESEFEQRAALKLLSAGVASEESLRRFEQERQILAALEHPGIARLLDGGRTEAGQPYFAMELVEGLPIDFYCDGEGLDLRQRLKLVLAVGRAVEHAHKNLVVHRDLKPSNIIVTAEGQVKLLDFGIAKLLQPDAGDADLTHTLARVLTPDYASPEQVLGQRITVASDVYQLGLLLFRLLTGQRPYRIEKTTALEIERAVCHTEPARPSAVVAGAKAGDAHGVEPDVGKLAAARATTPNRLARQLKGDLDTIVLKALRKEPERRYQTLGQLLDDLERHLDGLPVQARPDTVVYRTTRFVGRHRAAVAALALAFALLTAWAASATRQATIISRERDRAQAEATKTAQVRDFLVEIFASADPEQARGRELTARELLDRGRERMEGDLAEQPEVQLELIATVGEAYRELGLYDRARPLLERGVELAREIGAPREGLLLILAATERDDGRYEASRALAEEALELARELHGARAAPVAEALSQLGRTLHSMGDFAAARRLFEGALAIRLETLGERHPDTVDSQDGLAIALQSLGEYGAAEELRAAALATRREILPDDHPDLASNLSDLALVVTSLGDHRRAAPIYREALEVMIRVRGPEHPHVAIIMNNLARLLWNTGDLEESERLLRDALAIRRKALGGDHLHVALSLNDLGLALQRQGRLDEAAGYLAEALDVYPPDHPWRAASVFNLGRVLENRGDYAAAERSYREALASQRRQYGEDHERVGIDLMQIGIVRRLQGDLAGAETHLRQALEIFRNRLPDGHSRLAEALVPLGEVMLGTGRRAEAEPLAREALGILQAAFGAEDERTREAAALLARVQASSRALR
jgi:serine/threonine-protein kinase